MGSNYIPSSINDDEDNEISSASDLSSDEESASLDSFAGEASVVASIASSAATNSSSGLPGNILKQLIQDLHDQGGIDSERCNLETICSKKPDIYGKTEANKGTKFQQQRIRSVQNKVSYWKSPKGRSNYSKTLALYPPAKSSAKKSTKKQTAATLPCQTTSRGCRTPPRPTKSASKSQPSPAEPEPVAQPRHFRPSPPTFSLDPSQPTTSSHHADNTMTKSYAEQLLESVKHVKLNVTIFPEGQETTEHIFGPFYINVTENKVVNNQTVHNAYHIELKDQDLRWVTSADEEEVFAAWHVRTNQVLVRKPEPSYSFWKAPKEEEAARKNAKYQDERIIESYSVSRNAVTKETRNMYKYYLLTFTEAKLGLLNETLSPGAEDGLLDVDVHTVESPFDVQTSAGVSESKMLRCNIVWDIAIKEKIQRYKLESGKKKNRLNAKFLAGVESMKIN